MLEELIPTYCERVGTGMFSEPVNLISNVGFFLAAYFLWKKTHVKHLGASGYLFAGLLFSVGVGSSIFHAFPGSGTLLLDAVPIYCFILAVSLVLLSKLFGMATTIVTLISFVVVQILISTLVPVDFINGSMRHVTTFLALALLTFAAYRQTGSKIYPLVFAVLGYGIAILFRSLDLTVCESIFFGTHFMWHLLVSLAAYLAVSYTIELRKTSV